MNEGNWINIFILTHMGYLCDSLVFQPELSNNPVHFTDGEKLGDVGSHSITEASGLAASRLHTDILYTHNDKGDNARIFAIRKSDGHKMAEFQIQGAHNYDWEDLAISTCPDGGFCLYIVSKVQGGKGKLAHIPNSYWNTNLVVQITHLTTIGIPTSAHPDPVAGDISPDGHEVLIKTRENVYYWYVPDNNYSDILSGHPVSLPYIHENRGEALCWDEHGQGYYTLGEGSNKHIYYYRRIIPI
ncbi:hypothetical protein KUTeg_009610 [Tegillarca granosa]|uniref:Uncharacterized protein n=1 Tax=Tegillarca granosa TaxID=220873 RepID=A0ABQ9F8N8_TEGGR|nr:hypothetical protein KUTeg_009610 [Tegillarca granosa]